MFGLSIEHLLIFGAVLLIFGPKKLPELGASFGRAVRNFREGLNGPVSSGHVEVEPAPAAKVAREAAPKIAHETVVVESAVGANSAVKATAQATAQVNDSGSPSATV